MGAIIGPLKKREASACTVWKLYLTRRRCAVPAHLATPKLPTEPSRMEPICESDSFLHSPLRLGGRAIRLLNLQPSSDPSSNIKCTLQHVDLDDHPIYKALSMLGAIQKTLPSF